MATLHAAHLYTTLKIPEPTHFNSEDGDNIFLRKFNIRVQDYTVSQPRKITAVETPTRISVPASLPFRGTYASVYQGQWLSSSGNRDDVFS